MQTCDRCIDDVPAGEAVTVSGGTYCQHCGLIVAAEVLAIFLAPHWTPTLASIREGEEAVRVLRQLVPLAALMVATKIGATVERVAEDAS